MTTLSTVTAGRGSPSGLSSRAQIDFVASGAWRIVLRQISEPRLVRYYRARDTTEDVIFQICRQ